MGEPEPEPEQDDLPAPTVSTSEMCKEGSTTIIWHLKGWNENADFLKDNAGCIMEVATSDETATEGEEGKEEEEEPAADPEGAEDQKAEEPPPPPIKLRFFLKEYSRQVESKWKKWHSLWVSLLSAQKQVCFLVEVTEIEDEEEPEAEGEEGEGEEEAGGEEDDDDDEDIEVKAQITMSSVDNGDEAETGSVVQEEFIPMCWWTADGNGNKSGDEHLSEWAESDELKFKITVTLYHYSGSDTEIVQDAEGEEAEQQEGEETEEEEPVPMIRDLKAMYAREENYADVTLETRDGMILNAHKFVLAARSAYFRGIIEREVQKKGFTGLIKLANVDGKPMTVVLHWMYTDEIQEEQLGKVMDEVIKVSVKWELKDLLKMLDKKLISVCNTRNMLHLFQVAHKNGLYTAIGDISEYIKQNIDSVLPIRRPDS